MPVAPTAVTEHPASLRRAQVRPDGGLLRHAREGLQSVAERVRAGQLHGAALPERERILSAPADRHPAGVGCHAVVLHRTQRGKIRFDTEEHRQESVERIYRMATEVDKVVGDVINEIKKMGVYDNTLFVFTTDNGVFHGGT
jgi:arylsulfatase A-like enzyme